MNRAPGYLPVQSPLSKCLLWTRPPANWLQLTLYQDELENEHETFPFGKKKTTWREATHVHRLEAHACRSEICELLLGQITDRALEWRWYWEIHLSQVCELRPEVSAPFTREAACAQLETGVLHLCPTGVTGGTRDNDSVETSCPDRNAVMADGAESRLWEVQKQIGAAAEDLVFV